MASMERASTPYHRIAAPNQWRKSIHEFSEMKFLCVLFVSIVVVVVVVKAVAMKRQQWTWT